MLTLVDLSRKLASGSVKSTALVEDCLARIDDESGEGARAFRNVYADQARFEAERIDAARARGFSLPPFAGIALSIKDLFDVKGEVTRAGSRVLDMRPPADTDATIVARLRQAGFIILGKTNMTEFAYSGLGINAHFGTPLNPFERDKGRIPGGSTSGGAVSVADAMAIATIGTDTGGSCRIPAAFCGIVGFKPTSYRVPKDGVIPLSRSLDSVGPLGRSVSCCAVLDGLLANNCPEDVDSHPEGGLRLGVLEGYPTEHIEDEVAAAYQAALSRFSRRGVQLRPVDLKELYQLPDINRHGGLVGAEAYAWHRDLLESRSDFYDPWVRSRFSAGQAQSAADYIDVQERRAGIMTAVAGKTDQFDALVLPSVQIIAPVIDSLSDPEISGPINILTLRNTAIGNFLDRPSITIPCHEPGTAPVGLMLMGRHGEDRRLLSIARGLEFAVRSDNHQGK